MEKQVFDREPDNSVGNIWGNIEVGGKVVAQIYKSGVITTNSRYPLPGGSGAASGAEARARLMLDTYGGKLVLRDEMENPTLYNGA